MKKSLLTLVIGIFAFCCALRAQSLSLGLPFGDGMVLQRDVKVAVWGSCSPKTAVEVTLDGQTAKTVSDKRGAWSLQLSPMTAGGPYSMQVTAGEENLKLKKIYVGEVWIAGGQSNMQFRFDQQLNASQHLAEATNTDIHFLFVPQIMYADQPKKDKAVWREAVGKNVGKMSAVAYFFAKELQTKLGVPVGIICDYKGGTPAEAWMSQSALTRNPDFQPIVDRYEKIVAGYDKGEYEKLYEAYIAENAHYKQALLDGQTDVKRPTEPMGERNYKRPSGLYQTMLQPIMPYTVRGVIWYQGEANAPRAKQYQTLFPALIDEWRHDFKNTNMPFYFVQLSNYDHPAYGTKPNWAELREAQLLTWKKVKNTGMAVSFDYGAKDDIHPTNKQPVGERLAAIALHDTYGYADLPYSGPVYRSKKVKDGEVILSFDFAQSGLQAHGDTLEGFTLCGPNGKFVEADARIEGDKVIVSSPLVATPQEVRYGWSNYTPANLYNGDGFPATPFRTDDFTLITEKKK